MDHWGSVPHPEHLEDVKESQEAVTKVMLSVTWAAAPWLPLRIRIKSSDPLSDPIANAPAGALACRQFLEDGPHICQT